MTQYDAAATPMFASFSATADLGAYAHRNETVDLAALNPHKNAGAKASAELDLSDLDRADPDKMNVILWDWYKPGTPNPAPVRSLILVQ